MQERSSRLRQFNLMLGAMLLISSSFIIPASASVPSRNSAQEILIGIDGRSPALPPILSLPPGAGVPPPVLSFIATQSANSVSPNSLFIIRGEALSAVTAGASGVVSSNSENAPSIFIQRSVSDTTENSIFSSIFGFLFSSFSPSSSSAMSSASSPEGNSPYLLAAAQSGSAKGEAQSLTIRTDGEVISSNSLPDSSGGEAGQITFQAVFISSPTSSGLQSYSSTASLASVTSAIPGLWLDSSKRRSRSQIYVEILELMKRGPMTPFEIAFYARLNHKRTKEYVEFLKRSNYLETVAEDGRLTYVLTKNGMVFLEGVKALFERNEPVEYIDVDFTQRSAVS